MNTLYISSYVRDGGLYRFELTEDGALRPCGVIPADRPMYAIWQDEILYVLEREPDAGTHESALRRFAVRPDGAYRELGTRQSTQGVCAPHLCVRDGVVYAVNYLSGSVCRIPDIVAQHRGRSVHPTRQEAPHPHFITEAPDGGLLVTDLGLDRIIAYDAELNRIAETALRPGSGPRHLAFSPDGKTVFCANELSSTVCMYRYDGAGRITLLYEQPTLPEDFAGESTAAAIRVDGERVYVSNRGHDSIACLRAEGDALIPEGFLPCQGTGPRDFDIVGDKIVCTNETSDSVTVLDKQTGKLLSALCLPRPLCVTVLPPERR